MIESVRNIISGLFSGAYQGAKSGYLEAKSSLQFFEHDGYRIPVSLVNLTGGGPETFAQISEAHIASYRKVLELKPELQILEVGCGIGRDAIPLTKILSSDGRYYGTDLIRSSVEWCQENITKRYPNFEFFHSDVRDPQHNSSGRLRNVDIRLPLGDGTIDFVILQSVFTHMFERDILHYLMEFKRVLRPNGVVFATVFVVDDEIIATSQLSNVTPFNLRFEHQITDDIYINDLAYPLDAVGYTENAVKRLVERGGLTLDGPILRGAWSGHFEQIHGGQDTIVLRS